MEPAVAQEPVPTQGEGNYTILRIRTREVE